MKKTHLYLSVTLLSSLSFCKESDRIAVLEEELDNTTLIAYQLWDENDRLKHKVSQLQISGTGNNTPEVKPEVEPDEKKGPPESSKRKLFVMRMTLMNFQLRENRFPETVQELKEVLGTIPVEDRSDSNVIHLQKNGYGGWVYSPDDGSLDINTIK